MIVSVDKNSILNLFGVENFNSLESIIDNMSPSLVEYHLFDFLSNVQNGTIFNRRDIQSSFSVGAYSLYLDYSENIYLETTENSFENDTLSLW